MSVLDTEFIARLNAMERAIGEATASGDEEVFAIARSKYADCIAHLCSTSSIPKQLSTLLQIACDNPKGRRFAAIVTVRALAVDGLMPLDEDGALSRHAVALVEAGFPDACKQLKLSEKRQTFEKIDSIRGLHTSLCDCLQLLRTCPETLAEIDNYKNEIKRAVSEKLTQNYLQPYEWTVVKNKILHVTEQASALAVCRDSTYKSLFEQLGASCDELVTLTQARSFLNDEYVRPFLDSVRTAMHVLTGSAKGQFACSLETRRKQPFIAEKRYPLHRADEFIVVTVPMINTGPGIAVNVIVELDGGTKSSIALEDDEIHLGDIPPGEFAISFKAMIVEPSSSATFAMQVSWGELFGTSRSSAFDLRLAAQETHVDWEVLEQLDPYSLEEADSAQFVGRTAKVQAIGNRLLKAQMSSTYITGQKRVGKTSLAKAVLRYVSAQAKPENTFHATYLEWGEYSTADARSTVMTLGDLLYAFLAQYLPHGLTLPTPNFDGSLAPLNIIAKTLETSSPEKRFVIVLDEFDEIHPEMYRFGALAEVFFANLRTLAARKNLAFILVGGEKMPFIIGAQGDQLNKFVREPLDYFSRSDEWNDFVKLVTGPVQENLNWEESALNELFTLTNGHPYYTKLLCAKVFANAVSQRDTEIIARDVRHALNGRVNELDTNSFAHFWKDGINSEREAAEIIELKRLRLLVALGRAGRLGKTTRASIAAEVGSTAMQVHETGPLIDDFCRRDILKDHQSEINLQLPIFHRWLQEVGVSKLIASTLADDLEAEQRKANDKAYVTSTEIERLVKLWPLYRGRQITGETVRAWLEQVEQPQEQRLLFTLLENMNFVTTPQICENLRHAHERIIVRLTPPVTRGSKVEKRRDILTTYVDGPGKSGATYARAYAKENGLLMESVVEPSKVIRRLSGEFEKPNALVVVDDLAGTGRTMGDALEQLLKEVGASLEEHRIPLVVVLLYATEEAEHKISSKLRPFTSITAHLHVCNTLDGRERAFPSEEPGFWGDTEKRDRAKAICLRLGTGLYKEPLGFASQSLLLAFPDTCPNNNLPIIFASKTATPKWDALLPRPAS